ncbi:MAG: polysaccharide biosynthesis/export family protein [Planctomycetota bacterium]
MREPQPSVVGGDYRVGVPDTLTVTVRSGVEVRETMHTIGPDGRLWVAGFEPVAAADQTCAEIAAALDAQAERDAESPQSPSVSVRVDDFASQKIFVFGQVQRDGAQPYHGANTVLDAVSAAQPNGRADTAHIQVLRPSADGEFRRRMTVDFDALVQRGDSTLDVVLAGGDVVFVPPTALGSMGLAWDQLFGVTAEHVVQTMGQPTNPTATMQEAGMGGDRLSAQDLDSMREALSQLAYQLETLRGAQTQLIEATQELAAKTASQSLAEASTSPPSPPNDAVVFTTADVQRGGAGEGPRPEGVRFWGP